ncbi:MAG: hypothetical protein LC650_00820 [Actinobacteria bacterium]|nr:hypothetical protein [Actinomycetota bacterium]
MPDGFGNGGYFPPPPNTDGYRETCKRLTTLENIVAREMRGTGLALHEIRKAFGWTMEETKERVK